MSRAIKNKIKTYFTLYLGKETDGEFPEGTTLQPMRVNQSSMSVAGTAEEITSDIVLPESRIASTPEIGTESNSGDIETEWNIDEQDDLFAAVFCGKWSGTGTRKTLTLGDEMNSFSLLLKWSQAPQAWQLYKNEFVNQLTMDFQTDQFVKLTWNVQGANNPRQEFADPLASKNPVYAESLRTKSFLTKEGWLKIGDTADSLAALRQSPSMSITINNNLERTPALFETESIENALGNFDVTGTLDVYNVDDIGNELYNDAVSGKDKVIQLRVQRSVAGKTTSYTLTLDAHLNAPSRSRNGNKFQFSIPFTMNDSKNLLLEKNVVSDTADVPVFRNKLTARTYASDDSPDSLDGTATVNDGGSVTYSWSDGSTVVSTAAVYTPDLSKGTKTYTVTATNTINGVTAKASQSVLITVS